MFLLAKMHLPDVEPFLGTMRSSFPESLLRYLPLAQAGAINYVQTCIENAHLFPEDHFVTLNNANNGSNGAYAQFKIHDNNLGFLNHICVDGKLRRQGLASKLIFDFLETHSKDIEYLDLDVFDSNVIALELYTKLGFRFLSEAHWLRRPLANGLTLTRCDKLRLHNQLGSVAMHTQFGFSWNFLNGTDENYEFGRIGREIIRLDSFDSFTNEQLLQEIGYLFPTATEVFGIFKQGPHVPPDLQIFARSLRLRLRNPFFLS